MGTRLTRLGEQEGGGGGGAQRVDPLSQEVRVIKLIAHKYN
jgi:hypothetical protein